MKNKHVACYVNYMTVLLIRYIVLVYAYFVESLIMSQVPFGMHEVSLCNKLFLWHLWIDSSGASGESSPLPFTHQAQHSPWALWQPLPDPAWSSRLIGTCHQDCHSPPFLRQLLVDLAQPLESSWAMPLLVRVRLPDCATNSSMPGRAPRLHGHQYGHHQYHCCWLPEVNTVLLFRRFNTHTNQCLFVFLNQIYLQTWEVPQVCWKICFASTWPWSTDLTICRWGHRWLIIHRLLFSRVGTVLLFLNCIMHTRYFITH